MANYKHMEMAEALSNDSRINISRGFLGLKTYLTYAPTSSKINSTWSFGGQNGDKRLQKSVL